MGGFETRECPDLINVRKVPGNVGSISEDGHINPELREALSQVRVLSSQLLLLGPLCPTPKKFHKKFITGRGFMVVPVGKLCYS